MFQHRNSFPARIGAVLLAWLLTLAVVDDAGVADTSETDGVSATLSMARYRMADHTITVEVTGALPDDLSDMFQILDSDGHHIELIGISKTPQGAYVLELKEAIDVFKDYRIAWQGSEYPVTMPNLYSTEAFEAAYTYPGDDLGAAWAPEKTTFRVWAPTADAVLVNLYAGGTAGVDDLLERLPMRADANGTWVA